MIATALTIAGSDPSGGAGIQADLKTFHQFHVYGMSAVTLITVQNTRSVERVHVLEPELVSRQIAAVVSDISPAAMKTGALGNGYVIRAVAESVKGIGVPLVVDPVMISKHGAPLLDESAMQSFRELLLPMAYLVTPNIDEASALSEIAYEGKESLPAMAKAIAAFGPAAVLIKGGHRQDAAADYLYAGGKERLYEGRKIETPHTHGTGCTLSAAITALLARGEDLFSAVGLAKEFIAAAIESAPGLGKGFGPVNHFAPARVQ